MRDIEKDKAICEAASKGPWEYGIVEGFLVYDTTFLNRHIARIVPDGVESVEHEEANAHFIAEARQALPYWIAQYEIERVGHMQAVESIERLQARIRELEERLHPNNRPDVVSRQDHDRALERIFREIKEGTA